MSDNLTPALIFPPDLEDHYKQVVPMQAEQATMWRRAFRRTRWREFIGYGIAVIEAAAIASLFPLIRVIPVFVYTDKFGLSNTEAHLISELPVDHRLAGIDAILWEYVRLREHYVASEAPDDYDKVSAMSSEKIRENYQRWANPKFNDKAPSQKLGQGGFIRVMREPGGSAWIQHNEDYTKGVYKVTYCKIISAAGQPITAEKVIELIGYNTTDSVPLKDRVTYNYAGVVVTAYPGPESLGTGVKVVYALGGENPCDQ